MWFIFGGVTLIVIITYRFLNYYFSLWVGSVGQAENGAYEYKKTKKNGRLVALKVGVKINKKFVFTLRRENWWDKYFKDIRLSKEHQVGWKKFDDELYVVSDSDVISKGLLNNKENQRILLNLFKPGINNRISIAKLQCNSGRLWVEIDGYDSLNEEKSEYDVIARELQLIADKLERLDLNKYSSVDPYFLKSSLLLAFSSGLLINAIFQLYRLNISAMPITVDKIGLISVSIFCGTIITGVLASIAWYLLRNSSYAHLVMLEIITLGYLGAIGNSIVQLRDLNLEWDTSPPVRYESSIMKKSIEEGRRGSKYYKLHLSSWDGDTKVEGITVNVSEELFIRVNKDFPVAIVQHDGYLGLKWVKSIHALKVLEVKKGYKVISEGDEFRNKHKLSGFARF